MQLFVVQKANLGESVVSANVTVSGVSGVNVSVPTRIRQKVQNHLSITTSFAPSKKRRKGFNIFSLTLNEKICPSGAALSPSIRVAPVR